MTNIDNNLTTKNHDIIFRQANCDDYQQLGEIRCLFQGPQDLSDQEKKEFIKKYREYLNQVTQWKCWVAEINTQIIAHVFLYEVPKMPRPQKFYQSWGYIANVYTIEEYRNQGIGQQLIKFVQNQNQHLEFLLVPPSDASISFYEKAGFKLASRWREHLSEE